MGDVKKIALITSTSNFERHKKSIRAIHEKLKSMGEYVLYVLTSYGLFTEEGAYDRGEASIYTLLDEVTFDGCIIGGNMGVDYMLERFAKKLTEKGTPFVSVNFGVDGVPFVVLDGYDAACKMLEHLIVEHHCTKINFIPTSNINKIVVDSVRGYRDTLEKYNIPINENRIIYKSVSISNGKALLDDFDERGINDAEAVLCVHDVHSIGLCLELEERGYHVPEDILICSLNRSTNSAAFRPDISGAGRMDRNISQKACELLIDMINGKEVPIENRIKGKVYFGGSCGCCGEQEEVISKEFQQLVLGKIEVGNQIRQMMQYNHALEEVNSLEEIMSSLKEMYHGIGCPQFILCLNPGTIEFISSEKDFEPPANGKVFDDTMCAVIGSTERTGEIENVSFPVQQLVPMDVKAGDMILFYPIHHIEEIYGYIVFVNEYLPVDLYNYRICHESIGNSMSHLHRQLILHKSISRLDELHMKDALTGLHNRFAVERFKTDYIEKDAYCLIIMDMDGMKKINDGYGHLEGNRAIKICADVMISILSEQDLVTRYGGDEFMVLSSNVNVAYWDQMQKKINDEINRRREEQNLEYQFGVSFGYCISDQTNHLSFEECCNIADNLMYANKKARKANRVD